MDESRGPHGTAGRPAAAPGARPGDRGIAALVHRAWHRWPVKAQILATFVAINLIASGVASVMVVYNARHATLAEITASTEVAERYVRAAIAQLGERGERSFRLEQLPIHLSNQRHVRFLVTTPQGESAWMSPPADGGAGAAGDDAAPAWFAALVGVGDLARSVPVVAQGQRVATVTIIGEAGDEIAEVWQDVSDLALVALGVNVAVLVLLHVALTRLLKPLNGLAAGLRELERGHFRHRMERPPTRELADIVDRFNALAQSLCGARADNARLSRRLVAVQDDERRQLAAELHDELGPCLFNLKVNASSLSRLADALPADAGGPIRERTATLIDIGERIQMVNRRVLKAVRPMALGHVPLAEALAGLVAEFERHSPACRFHLDAGALAGSYGDSVDLTVYRCVQEGLTNAVRHAAPRSVAVAAGADPAGDGTTAAGLRLTVEDDGRGIAPDTRAGLGLTAMTERVTALGGTVALTRRPAGGTRLAITIPLDEPGQTDQPGHPRPDTVTIEVSR